MFALSPQSYPFQSADCWLWRGYMAGVTSHFSVNRRNLVWELEAVAQKSVRDSDDTHFAKSEIDEKLIQFNVFMSPFPFKTNLFAISKWECCRIRCQCIDLLMIFIGPYQSIMYRIEMCRQISLMHLLYQFVHSKCLWCCHLLEKFVHQIVFFKWLRHKMRWTNWIAKRSFVLSSKAHQLIQISGVWTDCLAMEQCFDRKFHWQITWDALGTRL